MRYSVQDAGGPAGRLGALMPVPANLPAASSNGVVRVVGQPGTMAVPAPKPSALPGTAAGVRSDQPSYAAPDVMYPSIYYTTPDHMHPPVGLLRDNPMPVPARSIYSLPGISQRMRRVGGQSQVGQPQVVQTWPQWRGQGG